MVASTAGPAEAPRREVESPSRRALRRLRAAKGRWSALVVIALFVAVAVLAPLIAPYDPAQQSWTAVRKAPSAAIGSAPTKSAAMCWRG